MRPPRRQILAGLAAGWSGLAGCSLPDDGGGTPTGTPTGTVEDLSYAAEVLAQPSTDAPAKIRAELANRGEATVRVGTHETIALGFEAGPGDAVLLFPETPVGPNDAPSEPAGGCWRYTDDEFLVRDVLEFHEVDPDDAFVETYRLYTRGESRSCLPDGEYRFATTVRDGEGTELKLLVDVTIDGGHVAVEASERLP